MYIVHISTTKSVVSPPTKTDQKHGRISKLQQAAKTIYDT